MFSFFYDCTLLQIIIGDSTITDVGVATIMPDNYESEAEFIAENNCG